MRTDEPAASAPLSPIAPARWVSTTLPVDRRSYVASGVLLLAVKYALEAMIVFGALGRVWSPVAFLSPLVTQRVEALGGAGAPLVSDVLTLLALTSLPFLAIGLGMSVRRCADAGLWPWVGILFAAPVVNFALMLALSLAPSRPSTAAATVDPAPTSALRAATIGSLGAALVGTGVTFVASQSFGLYGATVFFVLPITMGAVAGYAVNRDVDRGLGLTLGTAIAGLAVTAGALLLTALEGLVCLAMALPIAFVAACIGAIAGRMIARAGRGPSGIAPMLGAIVLLPLVAGFEHGLEAPTVFEVRSAVDVDAPPALVWQRVVSFPPLPAPTEWVFQTGIAVPLRARIEGEGVGAVRHCEFSTGAFVEPVTRWEPGRRLSFDVISQPPPMEEWSPWRNLHPPHLDASLRSVRGEFRLVPRAGGGTHLEGSTWYTLGLGPASYFRLWADAVIHRVHARVLGHVRRLAEADAAPLARAAP